MQTILQTPTPNLAQSLHFYQQLNFQVLPTSSTIVTDGQVNILINPDRFARLGILIYREDWSTIVLALKKKYTILEQSNGYLLCDPSGVQVHLLHSEPPIISTKEVSFALTGQFAGVSIETADIAQSIDFWESIGYTIQSGSLDQGWLTFSNGSNVDISLMKLGSCPHLFFNPSLTYFNGTKNLGIIQQLKVLQVPITEEITHFNKEGIVDNIIIRDPGGLGFFLFND